MERIPAKVKDHLNIQEVDILTKEVRQIVEVVSETKVENN